MMFIKRKLGQELLNELTRDRFYECLNSQFRLLDIPSEGKALVLGQVSELHKSHKYEIFSLLFYGPVEYPLQQRIYRLQHDRLGILEIFLVPVGRDKEGYHYEAVFNRMI